MGISRTTFAWLVTLSTVGLVSGLPHVTLADDAGSGKEVRAIRHDLPVLLRGRLQQPTATQPVVITSVSVTGSQATADWNVVGSEYRSDLVRKYDQWWLENSSIVDPSIAASSPPADAPQFALVHRTLVTQNLDGYQMLFTFASNDGGEGAITDVRGRAPTEAESWMTRGGNSYFFFSGGLNSEFPVHVQDGTTLDVWFPFVLDSSLHYALTIAHMEKPLGPIDGTLNNNVVHFVLPAFVLEPGATIMGEIEGDTWAHT